MWNTYAKYSGKHILIQNKNDYVAKLIEDKSKAFENSWILSDKSIDDKSMLMKRLWSV